MLTDLPAPAPRRPGSGWKRVVLWTVGVLAVLILVPVAALFFLLSSLSRSMDEQGDKSSAADALEQLLHPGYQIGEVVPVWDVVPQQGSTLQVTSFTCGTVIASTGTPIAGGSFCTAAVTMVNTDTGDLVFDLPRYMEGVRADGTTIRVNLSATNAANSDPKPYSQTVSPGQSLQTRVVFDAPAASLPIVAVVLHPRGNEFEAGVDFRLTDEERSRRRPGMTPVPKNAPVPTEDPGPPPAPLPPSPPFTPSTLEPPEPRKTTAPIYDPTLPRIGKAVTVGGARFVVSGFKCAPELTFPPSQDLILTLGHYCAVTVTATNLTSTNQRLDDQQIEGYLAKEPYPVDILGSELASGDRAMFMEEFPPGRSRTMVVLFEMHAGDRLDTVKLVGYTSSASASFQLR